MHHTALNLRESYISVIIYIPTVIVKLVHQLKINLHNNLRRSQKKKTLDSILVKALQRSPQKKKLVITKGLPGLLVGRHDFVSTALTAERCAPGRIEPSPLWTRRWGIFYETKRVRFNRCFIVYSTEEGMGKHESPVITP